MSAAEAALGKDGKGRLVALSLLGLSSVFGAALVPLLVASSASIVIA
ncbi:MAG TPA: hypothetical protein VE944_31200 [Nostoc sp.]|nr:hypothetical protein [Nostoc sp.]HYX18758.1 hypothetical protein [Nostoc sp.]